MESEATCPVRSTSMQELMAVTFGFNAITLVELTNEMSHITTNKITCLLNKLFETLLISC